MSIRTHNLITIQPTNQFLYCPQECHDSLTVFLRKVIEFLGRLEGVALLAVAMPHDCLYLITGTAVMQAVLGSGVLKRQSASPERGRATPASANVVLHKQTVLHHIRIGPYFLVRIFRKFTLRFADSVLPIIVVASCPRRAVAIRTTHFHKQILTVLHF